MDEKEYYYVVICEYKNDAAIVHETYLHSSDYGTAVSRMKMFESDPKVIRVAIAKLVHVFGNETLLGDKK